MTYSMKSMVAGATALLGLSGGFASAAADKAVEGEGLFIPACSDDGVPFSSDAPPCTQDYMIQQADEGLLPSAPSDDCGGCVDIDDPATQQWLESVGHKFDGPALEN